VGVHRQFYISSRRLGILDKNRSSQHLISLAVGEVIDEWGGKSAEVYGGS